MSPHQIIAVMVRLFAVWVTVHLPGQLYSFYFQGTKFDQPQTGLITIGILIVVVALVLGLWFFPLSIARRLLGSSPLENTPPASSNTWLATGCALIGLYLLTEYLPSLVRDVVVFSSTERLTGDFSELKSSIAYFVCMVAIALWLIIGATGFAKALRWARYAGLADRSDN